MFAFDCYLGIAQIVWFLTSPKADVLWAFYASLFFNIIILQNQIPESIIQKT